MIDWHCHILPGMDDGSRDTDESFALLKMLSEQEIDTAIATPHFYANNESVHDFIERRQKAYKNLMCFVADEMPRILLGAEVRYYSGIGKLPELDRLCIEGSKLLLVEMPMEKWTEYTVRELIEISNARGVKLILAHIERYLPLQSREVWRGLYEAGIMMQVNASFFAEFATRRKALAALGKGEIHMIGSDCHSIKYRPPHLDRAYEIIRKKSGDEFVNHFVEYGYSLLASN